MKINKRHELFAKTYLANGMNATQAYLSVYKCSNIVADKNGPKLLGNAGIQAMIEKANEKQIKKLEITRESQLKDLETAKEMAILGNLKGEKQLSAYVKAIEVQNKMLGLNEADKISIESVSITDVIKKLKE